MKLQNSIPDDILKIQKKMCEFQIGSRNYLKYKKILAKHTKKYAMQRRVSSNIKTIETIQRLEKENKI